MKIAFAHHEPINASKARWVAIVRTLAAVAEIEPIIWYTPNSAQQISQYARSHLGLDLPKGLTVRQLSSIHKKFGLTLNKVFFRALRAAIKDLAPDALWLRSDKLAAFATHKMPQVPMVYEAHLIGELWAQDKGEPDKKIRRQAELERQLYAGAAGVAAISDGLLHEIKQRFKYFGPCAIARSAVDRAVFKPIWRGGGNRVAYVGTMQFWKGLNTLLEAIALTELSLAIIGDGKEQDMASLHQTINGLGLSSRVTLMGRLPQPEIPAAIADCLCAVHPLPAEHSISARFTSPLKVMEYLSMGIPIVASDVPSVQEILTHQKNALLFEAGNPVALAAELNRLKDSKLAQKLSEQAVKDALKYTYQQRAQTLLGLFRTSQS